ncbi:hypothetical protein BKA66DRAFT_550652 [Pyrenochaeta sp. MPI-SDFR-AT-0127]|nr:hypothetical protein BKA66DRAFT_550652 [Pyrenochaeta sp. MPI-SDFR-AT-0127]
MRSTAVAIVLCYLVLAIDALPLNLQSRCVFWFCDPKFSKSSGSRDVSCDRIEKYSVDWFIDNVPAARKPKPATCLFYTRGLSLKAQNYAKKAQMTTIWDVWPRDYYNKRITTNNPLRCIMQQKYTDQRKYFQNMSKAFASLCDVFATVMDSSITPKNKTFNTVNKAGIWFKTEFPMLRLGYLRNKVNQIEAISPDGLTVFPYWTRKNAAATSAEDEETNVGHISEEVDADMDNLDKVSNGNDGVNEGDDDGIFPGWWEEDSGVFQSDL